MWTLQAPRRPSVCLLLVGGLMLVGCRDEERPTQPDQPCCGQCGYDGASVCQRCGYMDVCYHALIEGDPCSLEADGYCDCGDDPDCARGADGQALTGLPMDECDSLLTNELSSPGRSIFGGTDWRLYFSDSPACRAGDPR